jgi:3-oxoacyl-[acyl-carrier protein] reductase
MDVVVHDLDFTNRNALVVGGSSGIGNGIAQAFRARGAAVHIWGTRATPQDYADDPGSDLTGVTYAQVNAANRAQVEAAAAPFETLDTLILCQGTVLYGRREFQPEGWAHVMDINLNSLMWAATRFRPMLALRRGSIIIVSSVAGFRATRGNPAYSASKAGAVALTKTLGAAWITDGIRVNGIAPGLVDTKLTRVTTASPKRLEASLATIPAGRLGTPADMAGVALFLASDLAAYVVGQTIIVDGGMTLA